MNSCVLMFLLPLVLSAQAPRTPVPPPAPKPEDLGSISGKLLNAITDEPVRAATLRFDNVQSYTATTDAAGKFTIGELPVGRYRLSSDRTGFARPVYSGRNLTGPGSILDLTRGQKVTDLTLRILPHAVVTGRVTLPDRDPMSGILVAVMKVGFSRDGKSFTVAGTAVTNDLGDYRIFGLSPGKYVVEASERPPFRMPQSPPRPLPAKGEESYLRTFYPGVLEAPAATPIEVKAGVETRSIDIRLTRGRTVTVRGRVIKSDLPEGTNPSMVTLALRPGRDPADYFSNHSANFDARGVFEFAGVTPGSYDLMAITGQSSSVYSNRMRVEVAEDSIDNVTLTVTAGFTLTGKVRPEKEGDPLPANVRVRLLRRDPHLPHLQAIDAPVDPVGTFTIPNVSPDRYNVQVFPVLGGRYVKAVRAGDRDALQAGLDLLNGVAEPLDIVISANGGEVTGAVQDADSKPVANPTVVLIPQETERRELISNYRRSTAARDGSFRFVSVPPGEYKLFAWQTMEDFAYLDPEYLKQIESKGAPVTIRESSRQTVQLRSID